MPTQKRWMKTQTKPASPKIPDGFKLEIQRNADEFLESYLKPNFVLQPPQDPKLSYVAGIFTKWHQRYFYFYSKYRCRRLNCISESFESRFVRLEYAGNGKFNLSYMRHTGQWWEIFQGLSLEECFEEIKRQKLFHP